MNSRIIEAFEAVIHDQRAGISDPEVSIVQAIRKPDATVDDVCNALLCGAENFFREAGY
jgi:hypothetical protein